jgi:hypothetical protein
MALGARQARHEWRIAQLFKDRPDAQWRDHVEAAAEDENGTEGDDNGDGDDDDT